MKPSQKLSQVHQNTQPGPAAHTRRAQAAQPAAQRAPACACRAPPSVAAAHARTLARPAARPLALQRARAPMPCSSPARPSVCAPRPPACPSAAAARLPRARLSPRPAPARPARPSARLSRAPAPSALHARLRPRQPSAQPHAKWAVAHFQFLHHFFFLFFSFLSATGKYQKIHLFIFFHFPVHQ